MFKSSLSIAAARYSAFHMTKELMLQNAFGQCCTIQRHPAGACAPAGVVNGVGKHSCGVLSCDQNGMSLSPLVALFDRPHHGPRLFAHAITTPAGGASTGWWR